MRRKSESTSAAKREAHDRADAAMPDVAGLTVKQAEMALAEARNQERERREYERRKAKGKPPVEDHPGCDPLREVLRERRREGRERALLDNMRRGQHGLPQPRREREGGAVRPAPAGLQPVRADDAPAVVGHRARRRPPVDPSTRCSYPTSRTGSTACATRSTRCSPTARRRARRT